MNHLALFMIVAVYQCFVNLWLSWAVIGKFFTDPVLMSHSWWGRLRPKKMFKFNMSITQLIWKVSYAKKMITSENIVFYLQFKNFFHFMEKSSSVLVVFSFLYFELMDSLNFESCDVKVIIKTQGRKHYWLFFTLLEVHSETLKNSKYYLPRIVKKISSVIFNL